MFLTKKPPVYPPDWSNNQESHRRVAANNPETFLCWDDEQGTHLVTAGSDGIRNAIATGPRSISDEILLYPVRFDDRRDREYWQPIRMLFNWLGEAPIEGAKQWSKLAYKRAKREALQRTKNWDDVITGEVREWAWQKIRELSDGLVCVDNNRVARLGNTGQMRRYRSQKAAGCCGFYDEIHIGPDGKRYLIGFNFGH